MKLRAMTFGEVPTAADADETPMERVGLLTLEGCKVLQAGLKCRIHVYLDGVNVSHRAIQADDQEGWVEMYREYEGVRYPPAARVSGQVRFVRRPLAAAHPDAPPHLNYSATCYCDFCVDVRRGLT